VRSPATREPPGSTRERQPRSMPMSKPIPSASAKSLRTSQESNREPFRRFEAAACRRCHRIVSYAGIRRAGVNLPLALAGAAVTRHKNDMRLILV
jgi:hypothetical protein